MPQPVIPASMGESAEGVLVWPLPVTCACCYGPLDLVRVITRIGWCRMVPDLDHSLLVGCGRVLELFYTNPIFSAEEAKSWNLINWAFR